MLSERIKQIGVSPTMKIAAKAIMMKAEGVDLVDLSVGEPDFPTPQHVKDAAKKAIDENRTKYTLNQGIVPLREAICEKLFRENGLEYNISEILVSNGAKHSIFNVILSLVNEGDEVIIPAPYWVSYPQMVSLAQGRPVILPAREENGFKLTADELKNALTASTKAIILCNPSNPTGAVYSKSELALLVEVLADEDVYIIADEIYEKLVYDNFEFASFASVSEEIKHKTIIVNGMSKAFAMTGWRIGYAAGPEAIINGANKIQSHSTSNASTVSQYAALAAISGPSFELTRMNVQFQQRRNYILHRLQSLPSLSCSKPDGAFYVFPNVSAFFGKEYKNSYIRNSYGLCYYLLREAKVATVPGAAFGMENFIRISYANSMENIEKGMDRIIDSLKKLKTPATVKFSELNNTTTRIKKNVPVDGEITQEKRDALVAEAEDHLKYDHYYEWNANIGGIVVQLRTNNVHLYDFWIENWYPAQLEADLEPHGVIYAVDAVTGREPYTFMHAESKTGILFNTDYYGSLRRLALGLVSSLFQTGNGLHMVRGMSADIGGKGFILVGPKGTHKSELFYSILQRREIALHSNDLSFIRYGGGYASADCAERKLYWPTNSSELFNRLTSLLERSKCENVPSSRDECSYEECMYKDDCMLDRGMPYCMFGSKLARAMLDPYWIGGMMKHVKRTDLNTVFILKCDEYGEMIRQLDPENALQIMESGNVGHSGADYSSKNVPFFNPHAVYNSDTEIGKQRQLFKRLFSIADVYLLNTGVHSPAEIEEEVVSLAR